MIEARSAASARSSSHAAIHGRSPAPEFSACAAAMRVMPGRSLAPYAGADIAMSRRASEARRLLCRSERDAQQMMEVRSRMSRQEEQARTLTRNSSARKEGALQRHRPSSPVPVGVKAKCLFVSIECSSPQAVGGFFAFYFDIRCQKSSGQPAASRRRSSANGCRYAGGGSVGSSARYAALPRAMSPAKKEAVLRVAAR